MRLGVGSLVGSPDFWKLPYVMYPTSSNKKVLDKSWKFEEWDMQPARA